MPTAVRLSTKQLRTLSRRSQTPIAASASPIGESDMATTSPKPSGSKPASGSSQLENTLLFQIRASRLPEPVREFRFDSSRRWRSDFAWPANKLLVEVEGGHWNNGRHTRGSGFEADCEKYSEAALAGWKVVRVTSSHIKSGEALEWIMRGLE